MRKKQTTPTNYTDYIENQYDDMRDMLKKSRMLVEQEGGSMTTDIDVGKKREKEKTKVYNVSSGKIITHGDTEIELGLTDEEKTTYQSTMDDFIEQVSELVDYQPINLYQNNVEWGGRLIKEDMDFFFSIGESNGVFLSGDMMRLDEDFMETIEKLNSFYNIFSAKWSKFLANRKTTEINN
tara:strand:- start:7952 stop:8494 length:543 start_codon:yes stop_codon:yes gene_type:complete